MNPDTFSSRTLVSAFFLVGAIVLTTVSLDYSGKIQLKIGLQGIQLTIDNQKK